MTLSEVIADKIKNLSAEVEQSREACDAALEGMKEADKNYWEAQNRDPVVQAYTAWRKEMALLTYRQAAVEYYRLRDLLFEFKKNA